MGLADMPQHASLPRIPRTGWVLGAAAAATLVAWAVFGRMDPMPVMVGTILTEASVPLGYQLVVFPAFGAFVGALAFDVARARERRSWLPRALVVAATGALSVARLAGALPLSGHALFLFAVLGYELAPPSDRDAPLSLALVFPALLVVGWCKLVVWGDPAWFAASAVLGLAVGALLARAARA
jgi:hypothetical protein